MLVYTNYLEHRDSSKKKNADPDDSDDDDEDDPDEKLENHNELLKLIHNGDAKTFNESNLHEASEKEIDEMFDFLEEEEVSLGDI